MWSKLEKYNSVASSEMSSGDFYFAAQDYALFIALQHNEPWGTLWLYAMENVLILFWELVTARRWLTTRKQKKGNSKECSNINKKVNEHLKQFPCLFWSQLNVRNSIGLDAYSNYGRLSTLRAWYVVLLSIFHFVEISHLCSNISFGLMDIIRSFYQLMHTENL